MAAFPMVDATPVGSVASQDPRGDQVCRRHLTHGDNVADDGVAKGDVTRDSDEDVYAGRGANA